MAGRFKTWLKRTGTRLKLSRLGARLVRKTRHTDVHTLGRRKIPKEKKILNGIAAIKEAEYAIKSMKPRQVAKQAWERFGFFVDSIKSVTTVQAIENLEDSVRSTNFPESAKQFLLGYAEMHKAKRLGQQKER